MIDSVLPPFPLRLRPAARPPSRCSRVPRASRASRLRHLCSITDLAGFRVAVVVCIRSAHPVQGDDAAAFHVEVELLMGHFQCLLLVGSDFRQAVLDASVQGLFEWNTSIPA